ncbi:hypothetical protein [Sphingomonas sp. S-NIH.Pt15_0812]|uniref:hypothetical protein n=1 Tax=Sphingomonas sp. S-NIH.Pt15_0812 TaxID=1920129 RepID=UPI000F7D845D|nr:hypothetical protein [Sphingomonas sp. S-NIH.Pt15_0812]RSU46332.1 hypothetical protein BRX43_15835 [Sphingomonas sp. S-NIH.Pt15_0812]
MIGIGIKAHLKPLHRAMIAMGAEQVPFAMSLALNELAQGVAEIEEQGIARTFDTPTPFTRKAIRTVRATKTRPIATVAIKDIQAEYLAPYVLGGSRSLGKKRGMLAPRKVGLNQYGNLPKSKLASLKAKPTTYIGPIKTKSGRVISGVWQRPAKGKRSQSGRTSGAQPKRKLQLLIQFEDTTPVPKRLPFEQLARTYIQRHAGPAFDAAIRRALATARR